jgi:hypothetical protein
VPAEAVYRTYPVWPVIGVVLLALRYRRTDGAQRRRIRWLFLGLAVSISLWIPAALLFDLADQDNAAAAASAVLSIMGLAFTLGSLLVALFYTGVFGIDQPSRRAFVHQVLRVSVSAPPGDRSQEDPGVSWAGGTGRACNLWCSCVPATLS